MLRGRTPSDVTVYDFDSAGRLRRYLHAERANLEQDRVWRLQDVVVKQFEPPPARAQHLAQLECDSFLDAEQLGVLVVPPPALSPLDLYFYVRDLRARREQVPQEELRLWQQLAQPVVTLAMMLVAIPLVLGSNRSSTLSRRVLAGTVAGIGLYFVSQTLGYLGLLLHLPAPLTALALPTVILLFAGRLLRRLR
jgi:lipopolysaccharide export system permease protein